eukprot:6434620-Ditylum_brightwellii.AAC.1
MPPAKCNRIVQLICALLHSNSAQLKQFQNLNRKFQHAFYGIPGRAGLFSPLQMAMAGDPDFIHLILFIKETLQY